MQLIQIEVDINHRIINPGDRAVRRNEEAGWYCDEYAFEVNFIGKNPGVSPEHPFRETPPNPPPGHVSGASAAIQKRKVRPRAAAATIPDGTRYHYSIIIKDAAGNTLDSIDPDIIVEGDKP